MRRLKSTGGAAPRELVSPELVARCQQGDENAWRELVEATHRDVYTLCLRILGDPDDAAEATQDAYVKVWRSLRGFRGDAMFSTWLYRVATNTAISKHRGRARRRSREAGVGEEALEQIPALGSVEAAAGAKVEMARVEEALQALPPMYREAVVLRDVYGLGIEELAKQLGITDTAAKVRVHRGRKKLKDLLFTEDQR